MGSLSFKENEMTMQLIRTPQEKAGMAFHEAQLSSIKMQQIKNFITILETYKSDLESIAEQINECHSSVNKVISEHIFVIVTSRLFTL